MNIKDEIKALKEQKNAVILAHYYVADEIQEIADYVGDSFALSKTAATLPNPIIVYCGVSFMGESGCLLSPEKRLRTICTALAEVTLTSDQDLISAVELM